MVENKKREQRVRAFDSQTLKYVNEALNEQAPTVEVGALAAESMTLNYVKESLNASPVGSAKVQTPGNSEGKSSER